MGAAGRSRSADPTHRACSATAGELALGRFVPPRDDTKDAFPGTWHGYVHIPVQYGKDPRRGKLGGHKTCIARALITCVASYLIHECRVRHSQRCPYGHAGDEGTEMPNCGKFKSHAAVFPRRRVDRRVVASAVGLVRSRHSAPLGVAALGTGSNWPCAAHRTHLH
jgi:hypothetical protein